MVVGEETGHIAENENQKIISNYAFEGYRTIHKNEYVKECKHEEPKKKQMEKESEGES
jgi:hypothetical protein